MKLITLIAIALFSIGQLLHAQSSEIPCDRALNESGASTEPSITPSTEIPCDRARNSCDASTEPSTTTSALDICTPSAAQPLIEAKAGYFFFVNAKMRKIYDQGGLDLQVTGAYPIYEPFLSIYGGVEYLQRSGRSLHGHQKTRIWEWPISLGLRAETWLWMSSCTPSSAKYYFTFGPRYFFVRSHNDSSFVPRHMHASGIGLFANTGFLFIIHQHFTIDLFGEYSYASLNFRSSKPATQGETAQVGGLTFGGGLGYTF